MPGVCGRPSFPEFRLYGGFVRVEVQIVNALTDGQSDRLVIVADETYHAGALCEAMGFQQQARVASLCQEPRS